MDPFTEALNTLVNNCDEVTGATFADLDGQVIALVPHPNQAIQQDALSLCAALGGIALRKLTAIDRTHTLNHLTFTTARGHFIVMVIQQQYQLIVATQGQKALGQIMFEAEKAAQAIAKAI